MSGCMYERAYRMLSLPEITVPESLLVVSLRLWLLDRVYPRPVLPDWRGGLCAIGLGYLADDVVAPLFEALYGRGSWVEVAPLTCSKISSEEINLLTCVSLEQQKRSGELQKMLAGMMFPATARVVMPLIARLTHALDAAGMDLPLRTAPPVAPLRYASGAMTCQ